jgi:hypothetical protein
VSGFLWITTGYAYRTASSSQANLAPGFADLDGHILAVGAEGHWEGTTVTLGYARMLGLAADVDASESRVAMVNPFDAGTGPASPGRYDTASDSFGIALDVAWE